MLNDDLLPFVFLQPNMPQDRLKSVVYRSFLSCNDPSGVVECAPIRKNKTTSSHQMENVVESQKMSRSLNKSKLTREQNQEMVYPRWVSEDLKNPSSSQLLEISKGAQKLHQVIDSWSKRSCFDVRSKDVGNDLLRGALDLQESLVMLGKLQEASQSVGKLKRTEKPKHEGGGVESREAINSVDLNRFRDHSCQIRLEKSKLSSGSSSRDSIREITKVIHESLARQNLVPKAAEERPILDPFGHHNDHREFEESGVSSIGSSSRDCFQELRQVIHDSLARQNLLPNKQIDERSYSMQRRLSSASDFRSTSSDQSSIVFTNNFGSTDSSVSSAASHSKSKGSNLIAKLMGLEEFHPKPLPNTPIKDHEGRHMFDIDMPKGKKTKFVEHKETPQKKSLKELLETIQLEGLLKSNSNDKEGRPDTYNSGIPHSRRRLGDDAPPIVIIKPRHSPILESEDHKDSVLNNSEMLGEVKVKKWLSPPSAEREKEVSGGQLRGDETPIKRHIQRGVKSSKTAVNKLEQKPSKAKKKMSIAMKSSIAENKKAKTEVIDKKAARIQEVTIFRKDMDEKVASKKLPRSYDGKVTSTKSSKPEIKLVNKEKQMPRREKLSSSSTSKNTRKTEKLEFLDEVKIQQTIETLCNETSIARLLNEEMEDDAMRIGLAHENEAVHDAQEIDILDPFPAKEKDDVPKLEAEENCSSSQTSPNSITFPTIQLESDAFSEEANEHTVENKTKPECLSRTILKNLLLNSPSFLIRAEELFYLNVPKVSETVDTKYLVEADSRLSLDCANEIVEHKSLQGSQPFLSLLRIYGGHLNHLIYISLDRLLEEVCDGIENLGSYSKMKASNSPPADNVYAMLERDVNSKIVARGVWDIGWNMGFSPDEVEQIATSLEKVVLEELIEEALEVFGLYRTEDLKAQLIFVFREVRQAAGYALSRRLSR